MDMTESYAPTQATGGTSTTEEKTTDYFDFVVSPGPHGDGNDDDTYNIHRTGCRTTLNFLSEARLQDGFIKETNNNTLTALPPVSTITGSLAHIAHHNQRNRCVASEESVPMDQSDYWVSEDAKEQTCNILLEDLNKYCWTTQATPNANDPHNTGLLDQRRDSPLSDVLQVQQQQQQQQQQQHRDLEDRQNTDGAIYTLTVLNSEANSMDGLESCCKSPGGPVGSGPDAWRPTNHLDLDAILNMESSVSIGADGTGADASSAEAAANALVAAAGQFDDQSSFVQVKSEVGDNNNDWKLSDRNSLQESESSAESLLRNALQGKLYPGTARILTSNDVQHQVKDEQMQSDDLLLSQLDVDGAYRTADYEKLKSIANDVVESYCNLEPAVCSVSGTTVMYTLDPASGSLGTITLPAELAQVGTVTVVTTAPPQQEPILQDTRHNEQQQQQQQQQQQVVVQAAATAPQPQTANTAPQLQVGTSGRGAGGSSKPTKKYVRRSKANGGANGGAGAGSNASGNGANSSPGGGSGSPGSGGGGAVTTQRKERSLHYCSICTKGFKDKYSVNVHIRTHTGEKPFSCSLCGKSFRQKAHLAKHYQTHVTQKPSSVAAQAAQAAAAAQAQANVQANGTAPPSPTAQAQNILGDQIVAAAADSQIPS